jgi:hypothetical protein
MGQGGKGRQSFGGVSGEWAASIRPCMVISLRCREKSRELKKTGGAARRIGPWRADRSPGERQRNPGAASPREWGIPDVAALIRATLSGCGHHRSPLAGRTSPRRGLALDGPVATPLRPDYRTAPSGNAYAAAACRSPRHSRDTWWCGLCGVSWISSAMVWKRLPACASPAAGLARGIWYRPCG